MACSFTDIMLITVHVQTVSGKEMALTIPSDWRVDDIKRDINRRLDARMSDIELFMDDKFLNGNHDLKEAGINHGSEIQLLILVDSSDDDKGKGKDKGEDSDEGFMSKGDDVDKGKGKDDKGKDKDKGEDNDEGKGKGKYYMACKALLEHPSFVGLVDSVLSPPERQDSSEDRPNNALKYDRKIWSA